LASISIWGVCMTAINSAHNAAAATTGNAAAVNTRRTDTSERKATLDEQTQDQQTVLRIEQLPRELAWLLIYVGTVGLVVPGVIGSPLLIAGIAVLLPGGQTRLSRWASRKPRPLVQASLRQISRLIDDLGRRYPALPSAHPDDRRRRERPGSG
jgi:hypothetical protein